MIRLAIKHKQSNREGIKMKVSTYKMREIGSGLKNKTGRYLIRGKTCDGARWPEGDHYWIIDDCYNQDTLHVAVYDRPSWNRYMD